jgi:Na+/serine symporter
MPIWIVVLGSAILISSSGRAVVLEIIRSILHFPGIIITHPPLGIFVIVAIVFSVISVIKKYSLIPVISVLANLYLMTGLGVHAWMRFVIWLGLGLIIYFLYGYRKSRLNIRDDSNK